MIFISNINYSSFWLQLGSSFMPANYGKYSYVDKRDTEKFLTKFAVIIYVIIVAVYLFAMLGYSVEVTGGKFLSAEDGYYYRVKNGELKIDKPILIDNPANGVYVNITDQVEYFDGKKRRELIYNGYEDILLISRTNRVKVSDGSWTGFNYFVLYTDDDWTAEGWWGNNAQFVNINGNFIVFTIIGGLIFCFFYPYIAELAASVYSFIAKLLCKAFGLAADDKFLTNSCTYALVPPQIIMLIAFTVFSVMYSTDFVKGSRRSVYYAIEIIAAVMPLVLTITAAVADNKSKISMMKKGIF